MAKAPEKKTLTIEQIERASARRKTPQGQTSAILAQLACLQPRVHSQSATLCGKQPSNLRAFVQSSAKVLHHVITSAHGEGHDRHRRGFVRAVGEDARIANIQVRHIMGLRPFKHDGSHYRRATHGHL